MQALFPPFIPTLFKKLEQLTQIPLITVLVIESQEQVKEP
jgi:hypothetical protein